MNIKVVKWNTITPTEKALLLQRTTPTRDPRLTNKVHEIIESVRSGRDRTLLLWTEQLDRVSLSSLKVSTQEIQEAYRLTSNRTLNALKEAIRRITLFHEAQLPASIDLETSPGVRCERRFLPLKRVGLIVPGGPTPLPSTVLMLGVPSRIAGCQTRILATPPRQDRTIDPTLLVAADLVGIRDIYKMGGAQAVAAMAYGTESIPKVDKIFGPGNTWVTEAKHLVAQDPLGAASDLPTGPSEVMIIADAAANPSFLAADLLSQAEHGIESQVIFICNSRNLIDRVISQIDYQLERLPRKDTASDCLEKSLFIEVSKIEDGLAICNTYAPQHLIIQAEGARKYSHLVDNAGTVFIGPWTPESMGDYACGTNHLLPTYGFSRTQSGLSTENFMKAITFQEITPTGFREIGPVVDELARAEKLDGHANAVQIRMREVGPF